MSLIVILLCACHTTETIVTYRQPSIQAYEHELNKWGFDSICMVENISNDLDDWYDIWFIDDETGETIHEYGYTTGDSARVDCTYKLIVTSDSTYNYTKLKFNE